MVPERFARYIGPATRTRIAALANVPEDEWMQDWPLEVADPSRLDEFIDLLKNAESDDDRFALMELVLYSLDVADPAKQRDTWPLIETMLEREPGLYAREILYWSLGDENDDGIWELDDLGENEGFSITPLMRSVLVRVSDTIGLRFAERPVGYT
ncbi:MAG: hypothetical protein AB7T06_42130 [Kofleriaceae bacterium]